MKNYVQISVVVSDSEQSGKLIALLSEAGFDGFEESGQDLHAFIEEEKLDEAALNRILQSDGLQFIRKIIPEQNWNSLWEENFQPVVVNDFCCIRSAFHDPIPGIPVDIIITPKMSFGTGHHATTYMMIEAMQHLDFRNKTVLDFGTGTGVLAILAEKSGAEKVMAIDQDEWSIQNALENLTVNQCYATKIRKMDALPEGEVYDLILANINKNVIVSNLANMKQHLAPDGVLLVSGLLEEDFEEILRAASENHFTLSFSKERKNWICLGLEIEAKTK